MSQVPNYEEKYRAKLQQRALEQKKENGGLSAKAVKEKEKEYDERYSSSNTLPPTVKTLDQIMRLDLLADRTASEVGTLWTAHHAGKAGVVAAAIPADTYRRLQQTARANPLFVLPLPRKEGVEFFLLQFDYHQVHFTPLAEYKAHGAQARAVLTLTHYTDLIGRGVVLMRGELDAAENRAFSVENAQLLAMLTQLFYVSGGPAKRALVEAFNHRPTEFDYARVIEAAETM
ncbi:hypothetical protein GGF38_000065 [Coemansia sp. RSA 25]|nr:hypothetical protein GGF38_000065 [Coemansia sp. RSA 25]